jgi:hypothetical protein
MCVDHLAQFLGRRDNVACVGNDMAQNLANGDWRRGRGTGRSHDRDGNNEDDDDDEKNSAACFGPIASALCVLGACRIKQKKICL